MVETLFPELESESYLKNYGVEISGKILADRVASYITTSYSVLVSKAFWKCGYDSDVG